MKKILSLLIASTLAVTLLSGCGGKAASSGTSGTPVTLHVMHWNTISQKLIDKFEKENPNIKVEFEKYDVDKYEQVIKTRIAADETPDILGASDTDWSNFIKQGIFMDLTKDDFLKYYQDDAIKELKNHSPDGKIYAIPTNAFSLGLWTNRDLFDQNSVKVPTTYPELIQACDQLRAKGVTPFVQGIKDGWPIQQDMYSMFDFQVKNPGYFDKMKTGQTKWTDPGVESAFQSWADLFSKKGNLIDGSMGLTYEQAYQTFQQGKVAMWPMGSWATEFLQDKDGKPIKLPFNLDFVPITSTNDKGQTVIPGTYIGALYAISAKTAHPVEAKKFLEFLSKPENALIYAQGNGVLFPVKGLDYSKVVPYGDKVGKTTFSYTLARPFNMDTDSAVTDKLTSVLQSLAMGGSSVDKQLKDMQNVQDTANQERK
jgi:raffinose/stachyose/melibiose transport system substrate-binding protein